MGEREWLDGERFAAWLEEIAPDQLAFARSKHCAAEYKDFPTEASLARALHRWRTEGSAVSIFTADRYLTAIGLHLYMIPADLYIEAPIRANGSRPHHPPVMA